MSGINQVSVEQALCSHSDDERFNLHEVHLLLGISYPAVIKYVKRGWIQSLEVGGRKLVTVGELRRFNKEGNFKTFQPNSPIEASDNPNNPIES